MENIVIDDKTFEISELMNWPEEDGNYKVVQLYMKEIPYLIFDNEEICHKDILQNFLDKHKTSYKIIETLDGPGPGLGGPEYRVAGMGKAAINPKNKYASFFGGSFGYAQFNLSIDPDHLDLFVKHKSDWTIHT